MQDDESGHACPVHGVPMVPSGDHESGPIRPREEGRSVTYPVFKCTQPGCLETWTAAD